MSSEKQARARHAARPNRRSLTGLLVGVALTVILISGCGGQSSANGTGPAIQPGFAGTALTPVRPAPALALRNYLGDPVNLARYRGKAVLVTFLYTHCVDVCPLVTANLGVVLERLGPEAGDRRIRRPTRRHPKTVTAFLNRHHMTGRMKYLIGSPSQLARVWKSWHVAATRDPTSRKLVTHTSVTYGVSATGKLMTLYGPTFQPSEITHDIPRLISDAAVR